MKLKKAEIFSKSQEDSLAAKTYGDCDCACVNDEEETKIKYDFSLMNKC